MANEIEALRKALVKEVERYCGGDRGRIEHAKNVLKYAEQLLREEQAEPYVVFPAALLFDAGGGPEAAGRLLVEMGYEDSDVYEVCAILARRQAPRKFEDTNFKVVYDAALLARINEAADMAAMGEIEKSLLTDSGKRLAAQAVARRASQ